jgi:hypothetical protein
MCTKSSEYARGDDKLHNFKSAAKEDNITPIEALRGMDLKHRTSIRDMLDDYATKKGSEIKYPKKVWMEKVTDHINYCLLLLALIKERDGWK